MAQEVTGWLGRWIGGYVVGQLLERVGYKMGPGPGKAVLG